MEEAILSANISSIWAIPGVVDRIMELREQGVSQRKIRFVINREFRLLTNHQYTEGEIHGKIWREISKRQKQKRCPHCNNHL